MFKSITQDESYVYIKLADNTVISIPRELPLTISFSTKEEGLVNDTLVLPPMFDSIQLDYVVTSSSPVFVETISSNAGAHVIPDKEFPNKGIIRVKTNANVDGGKVLVIVTNNTSTIMKTLHIVEARLVPIDSDRVDIEADETDLKFHFSHNTPYSISIPDSAKTWCTVVKPTVTGYQLNNTKLIDTCVVVHVGASDWTKKRRTSVSISNHFGVGSPAVITFYIYQDFPVPKSSGSKSGIPKTYSVNTGITLKRPEGPDISGSGDRPPGGGSGAPPKRQLLQ